MIKRFWREPLTNTRLGQRFTSGLRIGLLRPFTAQLKIAKTDNFKGLDAFRAGIKLALRPSGQFVRKQIAHPVEFDGGGQAEQCLFVIAPGGDFTNLTDDKQRRFLHDTLADERAAAALAQAANQGTAVTPHAELVGKRSEDAVAQGDGLRPVGSGLSVCRPGQAANLSERRLDVAACPGVDAVCAAVIDIVAARVGKLPSAYQYLKVGVGAVEERLPGGLHIFIVASRADENIASTHERCAQRRLVDAIASIGLDDHPGQARMHRQAKHRAANVGQAAGVVVGQGAK